jgi:hypothetical protein
VIVTGKKHGMRMVGASFTQRLQPTDITSADAMSVDHSCLNIGVNKDKTSMAETRMLRTKIWSDGWFSSLSREAQLLYLYLISNKNTHICGFYELTNMEIMAHMKYSSVEMLSKYIEELSPNVIYLKGWVYIRNYPKHQNVTNNAKVQAAIERALEDVPAEILNLKSEIINHKSETMDSLSIPSKNDEKVDKSVEKVVAYGEFKNVKLSDDEKVSLINKYGREEAKKLVEELSTYISSSGKRYKNHYATLLNWARRKGLSVIPSTEPKMIAEMTDNGMVRMVPNPNYKGNSSTL